jgi:class 3 adenylate cyclase
VDAAGDREVGRGSLTGFGSGWPTPLRRLAFLGVRTSDANALRDQKVTLTIAAVAVTVLSVFWVGTYLALGLPIAAAIPFAYQVVSVVGLVAFARSKDFRAFRLSQIAAILVLPFLLQWVLGGYVASSAVSLWALEGALGAVFFFGAGPAIPAFAAFVGLTVVSAVIDQALSQHAASIPEPLHTAFFALNITGVAVTAYALLQYSVRARDAATAASESLLHNVLPSSVATRLQRDQGVIAEGFPVVTVLFADVVDFTPFAAVTPPERVVGVLDRVFSAFDDLVERHGVEKIKTIGDAYMAAAGVPEPRADHAAAMADLALDMLGSVSELCRGLDIDLALRIGLDSGPVVAGVIGRRRLIYDLWGDTVNTASRMESHGLAGRIQVTQSVRDQLTDSYEFEDRGSLNVKGKGAMEAYLLVGRRPGRDANGPAAT